MQNKRKIKTFQPAPDVATILETAQESGLELGIIINQAVRECGQKLIISLAKEKLESESGKLKKLRELAERTFNLPALQLAGLKIHN